MEYVICPSIIVQSGKKPFSKSGESLMKTMCTSNNNKIYIDSSGFLLGEYQKYLNQAGDSGIIILFKQYLEEKIENLDEDCISKINLSNFKYSDPRELVVQIGKHSSEQLLIQSKVDYKNYIVPNIKLLEPNDFINSTTGNITNIHHVEGGVITQPSKAIQKITN